ncbi:hypothetical protein Skr01_00810 [Sphaerisporangium krabiense]|nr:hypothetical protein Skr01_00810 [Sphaerisporangium krabiense]
MAACAAGTCRAARATEADTVRTAPPKENLAIRGRRGLGVVLDRIAPRIFHLRLPG